MSEDLKASRDHDPSTSDGQGNPTLADIDTPRFDPGLGQMVWGQPWKEHAVPDILDAALERIRAELQRVMWNLRQETVDPFGNHGASFRCPTFTVCSYSWDDELHQPYNFKHPASGLLVSWYKYMGRGLSANMKVSPDMADRVLTHCLKGLLAVEAGTHRWDEPGLYPDGHMSPDDDGDCEGHGTEQPQTASQVPGTDKAPSPNDQGEPTPGPTTRGDG